jgi:hypothetical protein
VQEAVIDMQADAEMRAAIESAAFRSLDAEDGEAPAPPAETPPTADERGEGSALGGPMSASSGAAAATAATAAEGGVRAAADDTVPGPPLPLAGAGAGAAPTPLTAPTVPWVVPTDGGTLSDMSDDDLDGFILGEVEVQVKTKMWHEMNKDYLEKQAAKAKQAEQDKELGISKPAPKKRKRKRINPAGPASSADEAVKQMLSQKKVSKKINYAKLKELGIIDEIPKDENPDDDDDDAGA